MKLLIETINDNFDNYKCDGLILALRDYSVQSIKYYSMDEIKNITKNSDKEIFIKMNKNMFNSDIENIKSILIELDKLNISGIFFYDLALVQIKKELDLKVDLIWDQTHMVNNYRTCDFYYDMGVKYALLSKEITLDEIKEIINKSKINCMVEVVSIPSIAYSRRKLLTSYFKSRNSDYKDNLEIEEKISNHKYLVRESNNGTSFYDNTIMNGTGIIKELEGTSYIIMREYGIDEFRDLVNDTYEYINNKCKDTKYISKYKKLGDNTNFFYKETVFKVK